MGNPGDIIYEGWLKVTKVNAKGKEEVSQRISWIFTDENLTEPKFKLRCAVLAKIVPRTKADFRNLDMDLINSIKIEVESKKPNGSVI